MQTVVDIETFPWVAYGYGSHYEPVIVKEIEPTKIISIAYCFGDGPVRFKAIWDFSDYRPGFYWKVDDKTLLEFIDKEVLSKSTEVCGHNVDSFDLKTIQDRMLYHKMSPSNATKTRDTLKLYRKYFKNPSNKLAYLSEKYGESGKIGHEGVMTYVKAALGDKKQQGVIRKYNIRDVEVTRERLKDVMLWEDRPKPIWDKPPCPKCGSTSTRKRGPEFIKKLKKKFQIQGCNECGHRWPTNEIIERV